MHLHTAFGTFECCSKGSTSLHWLSPPYALLSLIWIPSYITYSLLARFLLSARHWLRHRRVFADYSYGGFSCRAMVPVKGTCNWSLRAFTLTTLIFSGYTTLFFATPRTPTSFLFLGNPHNPSSGTIVKIPLWSSIVQPFCWVCHHEVWISYC